MSGHTSGRWIWVALALAVPAAAQHDHSMMMPAVDAGAASPKPTAVDGGPGWTAPEKATPVGKENPAPRQDGGMRPGDTGDAGVPAMHGGMQHGGSSDGCGCPMHGGMKHGESATPGMQHGGSDDGCGCPMHGGMKHGAADLPMTRVASGTAWQPDSTPHSGYMLSGGGWDLMAHYLLFGGYDLQLGPRGGQAGMLLGWVMGMASRDVGPGRLGFRAMASPEPFTISSPGGYPLLLQSGETYAGEPLHDRQHPHDLLMELAADYRLPLRGPWAIELYGALAGEPALGPPGFPHRLSASADPGAPLSHHWQDSTHISFGVLTAGVGTRLAKLEVSWFNGREPDERRTDLELAPLDSFSTRLAVNPTPHVSAQVSYGYLANPERHAPGAVHRLTASVMIHRPLGPHGFVAHTAVFGRNLGEEGSSNSWLLETLANLDGHQNVFARLEWVRKSGHDLVLPEALDGTYAIASLAGGYLYDFGPLYGVSPGLGARVAVDLVPEALSAEYGGRLPIGGMIYLRLTPPAGHGRH